VDLKGLLLLINVCHQVLQLTSKMTQKVQVSYRLCVATVTVYTICGQRVKGLGRKIL